METIDSLFLLNEEQRVKWLSVNEYNLFFALLRPEIMENIPTQNLMRDLTLIYYYQATPLIDDKLAMMYILRKHLTEEVTCKKMFKRIQVLTRGDFVKSIVAAGLTINIFADFAEQMDESNQIILKEILSFNEMSKQYFEEVYESFNDYPKYIVSVETHIMNVFRRHTHKYPQQYEALIRRVFKFINEYDLNQKDMLKQIDITPIV